MVKVVYAILAILMGGSLFLTVGGFNIAEIFNSNSGSTADVAKPYEEEAERIEAKLEAKPEDPDLLLRLTRAQINAGNNLVDIEDNGQRAATPESTQQYLRAYQSWSDYLEATKEPSANLALVVAPMMFQLAEVSRTYSEASTRIQAAADAQRIVAEQRPSVNSWTTLALYTYYTGDTAAAEKAADEAKKFVNNKSETQTIDQQLEPVEKSAQQFLKRKANAEKAEKTAGGAGGGTGTTPENLENPFGGLSGGGVSE
ncbi:MAG TPA: hypothetical protein VF030_04510 [Solirubrobacterales bacterium]